MLVTGLYGEIKNRINRHDRIQKLNSEATNVVVKRSDFYGNSYYISSNVKKVSPGDVICLTNVGEILWDAILLNGSMTVDESSLTGQRFEITKEGLPNTFQKMNEFSHQNQDQSVHFLFSGTTIIESTPSEGKYCEALVIKPGNFSTKGKFLKSLFATPPRRYIFLLFSNSYVIGLLTLLCCFLVYEYFPFFSQILPFDQAALLSGASTVSFTDNMARFLNKVIDGEIITLYVSMVPVEFPVITSLAVLATLIRLKNNNIFCTNSWKLNMAGSVSYLVLDKTGTLTEKEVTLSSICVSDRSEGFKKSTQSAQSLVPFINNLRSKEAYQVYSNDLWVKFIEWMSTWHSIVNQNGELFGDKLDIEMFNATNWCIVSNKADQNSFTGSIIVPQKVYDEEINLSKHNPKWYGLSVLHSWKFESKMQRTTVIVQNYFEESPTLFVKGAPEVIEGLWDENTLPVDFYQTLWNYTQKGMRVVALAYKSLSLNDVKILTDQNRSQIESDLIFIGFISFTNEIKSDAKEVIEELQEGMIFINNSFTIGKVNLIMATGDNISTSVTVSNQLGLISKNDWLMIDFNSKSQKLECSCSQKASVVSQYALNSYNSWNSKWDMVSIDTNDSYDLSQPSNSNEIYHIRNKYEVVGTKISSNSPSVFIDSIMDR